MDDRDTRVILLFLETVRDAARLAAAARTAHAAGKPVVAYKLGRSGLGEALARSHTGALAGSDRAIDAYFRDCGIVRVDLLETLIEIAPLVAGRKPPGSRTRRASPSSPRPAAAPRASSTGWGRSASKQPRPTSRCARGSPRSGVRVSDSPIVDLTLAGTSETYDTVLQALLDSPACDAVLAAVGSSAMFHPQLAVEPILHAPPRPKPLAAFLTPHAERSLALLAAKGVPAFRTPEACADALAAFFAWRAPREQPAAVAVPWPADLPRQGKLDEAQALALFGALGVPVVESAAARAPDYAHALEYPVAAKIRSPDIAHKTEAGGVALGIGSPAEYDARVKAMLAAVAAAHPGARIDGVLVQRMTSGLAEAIVGYRHDPLVGPIVLVGAGGTLAEIYRDYALRLAPVTEEEAASMIAEVKGLATIRGYRNLPHGDVAALARAVAALSRLALVAGQPVAEAEINPLIVRRDGVVAVDGLVLLKG